MKPIIDETQGSLNQDTQLAKRISTYGVVATELALLSNRRFSDLLAKAESLGSSIGGASVLLEVAGSRVFAKKIRLTDVERQPENTMSTANLFDLPLYYQYGRCGCHEMDLVS